MWLIEYDEGCFVDGEAILSIEMSSKGLVGFTTKYKEAYVGVSDRYIDTFLNNLQAINDNLINIQSRYYELKGENK